MTIQHYIHQCQFMNENSAVWLTGSYPFFPPDQDACKLYCLAEGYDFFFALSSKVKDGTPCAPGSPNVCIDGVCEVLTHTSTQSCHINSFKGP